MYTSTVNSVLSNKTWHHIAISRDGTTQADLHVFVDGKEVETYQHGGGNRIGGWGDWDGGVVDQSGPMYIGSFPPYGGLDFEGYVDELRIIKGTALWYSDFTVPDEEFHGFHELQGTFTSDVIEVNSTEFGSIHWDGITNDETDITIQIRTGDTANPDYGNWTAWSEPLPDTPLSQITTSPDKYLQYKLTLTSQNKLNSPGFVLNDGKAISIDYIKPAKDTEGIDNLAYIKVTEDGITTTYDELGVNIDNPNEGVLSIPDLIFDSSYLDELNEDMPGHRLNSFQKVITVYDKTSDVPIRTINADHSITYYDEGYATKVEDKNGTLLVLYTYGENKKLLKTEFIEARKKLEEG